MFADTAARTRRLRARKLIVAAVLAIVAPLAIAPAGAHAASVAKGALKIRTATLPAPIAGAPYATTLRATGGVPPYHWSLGSKLPKGLSLSNAGAISGVPEASGTRRFLLQVADSAEPVAATASRAMVIDVGPQQLYVANGDRNTVTEYGLPASGNAPAVSAIGGGSSGLTIPSAIAVGPNGEVYVVGGGVNTIAVYASGTTKQGPIGVINGPDTGLSNPSGLALDSRGNLYVGNFGTNTVTEYAPGASGDSEPIATIGGSDTGFSGVEGIAIDPAGEIVVGAGQGSIEFFPPGADGDFAPIRLIGGLDTEIEFPRSLQYDAQGDLYVLSVSQDPPAIIEFAPGAVGNATPTRSIFGPNTLLANAGGLALDDRGQVYVTSRSITEGTSSVEVFAGGAKGDAAPTSTLEGSNTGLGSPAGIAISSSMFVSTPRLHDGDVGAAYSQKLFASLGVAPYHWRIFSGALPRGLRLTAKGTITGTPKAPGIGKFTLAVTDSAVPNPTTALMTFTIDVDVPDVAYVANSTVGSSAITIYLPYSGGDGEPVGSISGPDTGLAQPQGVAFDATARLYVANYDDSVTEYAPDVSGDAPPVATIAGAKTGLFTPAAVAVDASGNLFVANELAGTVTEYAPGAHGNAAPTATITGLGDPVALAFDPEGRLWVNSGDTLEAFTEGQSGAATPVATLGGADTGLSGVKGFAFDNDGWLHVSNVNSSAVTTYEPGAVNDALPFSTFAVSVAWGEAVDAAGDAFVVQNAAPPSVFTYSRFGSDEQTVTQGDASQLSSPTGVAMTPVALADLE